MEGPWLCIDDFNVTLNFAEKLSRQLPQSQLMDDFREALEMCHLEDLGYRGYPFTWNNKRPGDANTNQWLDAAVANGA